MYILTQKDIARFWMYVKKTDTCWEWQASLHPKGYGRFQLKNKTIRAHRISYFLFKGKISKRKVICHACDNPKCVNPSHLWEGSNKDNTEDMIKKGRLIKEKGKWKKKPSKYYGVTYRKDQNKWRSRYMIDYKNYLIGQFNTELESAKAYDEKIKELGLKKPLNFPEDCPQVKE